MNRTARVLLPLLACTLLVSCKKSTAPDETIDPANIMGGDVNVAMARVNNTVSTSVKVGTLPVDLTSNTKITANNNGVATYHSTFDPTKNAQINQIVPFLPMGQFTKDAAGKVTADINAKITSEGIQDYTNVDGKAHTIVKYSANVGDKFNLVQSNGVTISRTVTQKSVTDDFAYNGMFIKTSTVVEQSTRIPGVTSIMYKANHTFGLVYVELTLNDGSKVSTYLYPSSY